MTVYNNATAAPTGLFSKLGYGTLKKSFLSTTFCLFQCFQL